MPRIALPARQPWPAVTEYGRFLSDGRYELTDPRTPRPWLHMLSNEDYLLSISQLGSGFSCFRNVNGNTITPSPGRDGTEYGRFFYIRDAATGDVFSPTVHPVHTDLSRYRHYRCVYAPGHLAWECRYGATGSRLQVLVHPEENTELYLLELTNDDKSTRTLDCFVYLEWAFRGGTSDWGFRLNSGFEAGLNALYADAVVPPEYRFWQTGFITASEPILDYDCRLRAFMGTPGGIAHPAAVAAGKCFNTDGPRGALGLSCGAARVRLTLAPGQTVKVMFAIGVVETLAAFPAAVVRYRTTQVFEDALSTVARTWKDVETRTRFDLPDGQLLPFLNTWLPYQVMQNARWTRYAADKGYRDVLQDAAGSRMIDPPRARRMIVDAVRHQRADGHAPRQWSNVPFGKVDWRDYRDSCFWLVYGIDAYLRETGDRAFLDEPYAFIDNETPQTVWAHLNLAVDYLWAQRGAHGLCLVSRGDWNDSMNRVGLKGKGESVWLTQALAWALLRMIEIAAVAGHTDRVDEFKARHAALADVLNTCAWDGRWYVAAFTDSGQVVGSHTNRDGGRIFLNSQSWAVLSQTAPADRIRQAFDAVREHLESDAGPLLFTPAYTQYDPEIGRITIGAAEADAVYVHATTFKMLADCMLGDGDGAYDLLRRITPAARALPASQTGAEPFCFVNNFEGPGWAWPGWNHSGWWTGTCDWVMQLAVESICGARAEYSGLRIAPCLPRAWESAHIRRTFRNAVYDIAIRKPLGMCRGAVHLAVDGRPCEGDLVPAFGDRRTHNVECQIS